MMVSRIGATNLVESDIGFEWIDSCPSVNSMGNEDPDEKFISNPIRYDRRMAEKLEKACSIGLVLIDEAEEIRDIPFEDICTDQKVVVREKVRSMMETISEGKSIPGYPVVVRFEYGNEVIIRDGNHRASAERLLGASYLKCKVIHVKDSYF